MKVTVTKSPLPADLAAQLPADEAAQVAELGARSDCLTLAYVDAGKLAGYAIFGHDEGGFVVIYMARSMAQGLAAVALKAVFGAAQVMGKPLRVHTEKVRAMARMMGADLTAVLKDSDGIPMGAFHGV